MFLRVGRKLGNVLLKHPLNYLNVLHSSPWFSEISCVYWRGNIRNQNRVETVNSVGAWVKKKKKNLSRYSSLIGIVFVNLVTLILVSVNYAITFTCLEANLLFLLRFFSENVLLCSEVSAKILAVN